MILVAGWTVLAECYALHHTEFKLSVRIAVRDSSAISLEQLRHVRQTYLGLSARVASLKCFLPSAAQAAPPVQGWLWNQLVHIETTDYDQFVGKDALTNLTVCDITVRAQLAAVNSVC